MKRMEIKKPLHDILVKRLRDEGWDSNRHFVLGSKVPYTMETTRRAFSPMEDKGMDAATLAIIMKYLNFSPAEIRDYLKTYTDDKDLWPLIGEGEQGLSREDEAILEATRLILKAKPELMPSLAAQLDVLALAAGIDVTHLTDRLRRKPKKGE